MRLAEVKEGPADCSSEAVVKKMKRHKTAGLSGMAAEMIQATGDIGTQWILDLCNGTVKEASIPEDWKSSVVLPIYKGSVDRTEGSASLSLSSLLGNLSFSLTPDIHLSILISAR